MPLPPFTESGDLPAGVHPLTLREVAVKLGQLTPKRKMIARRLERIYRIATETGLVYRFIVFGSFVTLKPDPNDVDVFMLMENQFDFAEVTGEARLLFDHGAAATFFGASVFWLRRLAAIGGEEAAVQYWQIKREGGQRGVVEIVGE